MVQFVLSCDLHLSMSWPLQIRLLGHISVATWQNIVAWVKAFVEIIKYFEQFVCDM